MPSLNYLISATVRDDQRQIEGKILSRPVLYSADGVNTEYVVDVDIGQIGRDPISGEKAVMPLRNVPVASGNFQLRYADAGSAVILKKTKKGRWRVVGFSKESPDKYFRVAVTIPDLCLGLSGSFTETGNLGLRGRPITLGELATIGGGFGIAPLGAIAIFRGETLLEVKG